MEKKIRCTFGSVSSYVTFGFGLWHALGWFSMFTWISKYPCFLLLPWTDMLDRDDVIVIDVSLKNIEESENSMVFDTDNKEVTPIWWIRWPFSENVFSTVVRDSFHLNEWKLSNHGNYSSSFSIPMNFRASFSSINARSDSHRSIQCQRN